MRKSNELKRKERVHAWTVYIYIYIYIYIYRSMGVCMGLQWVDLSVIAVKEIRVEKGLVNLNVPVTQSIAIKARKI